MAEQPDSNDRFNKGWPELVGRPWKEAEDAIRKEFPQAMIQVLPELSAVTMDYRPDRIRIFINDENNVVKAPLMG